MGTLNKNSTVLQHKNKLAYLQERGIIGFSCRRDSVHLSCFHNRVRDNAFKKNDKSKKLLGL